MKILIINPPIRENDNPSFPLGLGYLAAILRKEGHKVSIIDAAAYRLKKGEVVKRIQEEEFDIVAIGGLITLFNYIKELVGEIKKVNPNAKIISGGSVVTTIPNLFLKETGVDIGLLSEADETLVELIQSIENNKSIDNIKGIVFKNNLGEIKINPLRERIKDLDSIPFPAYDLFPMDIYLKTPLEFSIKNISKNRKWTKIIATRGCPYRCTFCFRNFGNQYTTRSSHNIIAEMELLYNKYGITFFNFHDENFIVNKEYTSELCDKFIEKDLDFKWCCLARADSVTKELLQKMKKAGCVYINFGLESGSQKMLDAVNKQIKVETMEQAIKLSREVGIEVAYTLMIGIPGETKETVQETIDFCKKLDLQSSFFICTPYPGTLLWDQLKKDGKITTEEELEYIKRLSDAGDAINLNMNVSGLSDEELLNLRSWAAKEVTNHYYKKHPIEFISSRVSWIKYAIKTIKNIYKSYGISSVALTIYNKLSGKKNKIFVHK